MKKIVIIAALVCGAWQQADAQYVSKVWVPDQKDGCNASRIRDHYLTEVCPFTHDLFHVLSTFRVITVCDHQTFACGIAALFARNLRHPVERPGHADRKSVV